MLDLREVRQRLALSEMTLSRVGASDQYRVSFMEDSFRDERNSYYTDCIEDALFKGQSMRRDRAIRKRNAV